MNDDQVTDLASLIGKRVRLDTTSEEDDASEEHGYIIHAWLDPDLQAIDCYVAFFGEKLPEPGQKPTTKPYVLKYLLSSLQGIE